MKIFLRGLIVLVLLFAALPVLGQGDGDGGFADVVAAPITYEDLLQIGVPVLALIVALVAYLRSGNVAAVDQNAAQWFREKQADRDYMDRIERMYFASSETQRKMFDAFTSTLRVFAPYTPFSMDDEAADFLSDVQERGAPSSKEELIE